MNKSILIFTATYNEAENIENFLKQLEDLIFDFDILVIDDNSPDKTWEKIKNYALNKKNIKLIIRKDKEGLDTAHKLAFKYSKDNNVLVNAPHSQQDLIDWSYPNSVEKGVFPVDNLKSQKQWPTHSRINDVYGDTNLIVK